MTKLVGLVLNLHSGLTSKLLDYISCLVNLESLILTNLHKSSVLRGENFYKLASLTSL